MKKEKIYKIVKYGIFIFFSLITIFFVFKLRMGLSPDSFYHLEVSRAYSTTLTIPQNTPDTYQWRDITRIAYLYFWINGRILNINNGFLNEVILLRLINVIYSFGTLFFTYLLSKEVLKNKWLRLLPTFLLANTLMFLFISSSINYDNLGNFLSVLGIYLFVKFVKSKLDIKYLLYMLIVLSLGTLTKYTILPLAFILVILSLIQIFLKREILKDIKWRDSILLLLPLLILAILNIQIYGINIIRYGGLEPRCDQILTHEQCLTNGVYYRDLITYPAKQIEGFGYITQLIKDGQRESPLIYFVYWIWSIVGKIYGIMGDSSLEISNILKVFYLSFLSLGVFFTFRFYKKWDRLDKYLIGIFLFYTLVLFLVQNYNMYLKHNHMYLALQGRYLFPVLPVGYLMYVKSISFIKDRKMFYLILLPLLVLFIYSCVPFFFLNVPTDWFVINF